MEPKSKVTIIMPNYNGAKYIGKAIHSVFSQNYSNWELLIVDDCSTDSSINIMMKWRGICKQIYILSTERNSGSPAAARNMAMGLRSPESKYIAFLDSDDYWRQDKLEKQVKYMEYSIYYTGLTYHDAELYSEGYCKPPRPQRWSTRNKPYQGHCFNQLFKRNFMPASSIMVRADVIDQLSYWQDISMKISHDWDMWLRIANKYYIGYIPQALGTLRLHSGSTSAQTRLRRKESREVIRRWKGLVPAGLYYSVLASYYLIEIKDLFKKE